MKKLLLFALVLLASCDGGKVVGVAGRLSADPKALDFGTLKVGQPAVLEVRLANEGRRSLDVSLSVEGGGFSLSQDRFTLSPSESIFVSVGFRADAGGSFGGRLLAQSTDSSVEVALSAAAEECGQRAGCVDFRFEEASNGCVAYEVANGAACAAACADTGICLRGLCIPAPAAQLVDCSDEDVCTQDRCDDRLGCVHEPLACDDANACTRDSCDVALGCLHDDVTDACTTDSPCQSAMCDVQLGCRILPVSDGTACGPASCREEKVCMSGACVQSPGPAGTCGCDDTRPVRTLSVGSWHTCRITASSTLECWGGNDRGQLGDGSTANSATPQQVLGLGNVAEVSAAGRATCARTASGEVYCWGANDERRLGPSTDDVVNTPMLVTGLPPAVSVSTNSNSTCIAATDGTVWCWGEFAGDRPWWGPIRPPFQISGLSSAIAVSVGLRHICALLQDRTIRCWGLVADPYWEDGGTATVPTPGLLPDGGLLDGVVELESGTQQTCVLTRHGEVRCTGGYSEPPEVRTTYLEPGHGFGRIGLPGCAKQVDISVNNGGACVRLEGDAAACWGMSNAYGQLGTGDTLLPPSHMSDVSGLQGVEEIATWVHHSCAILGDGGYRCWGSNGGGQLGDGTFVNRNAP